MSFVLEKEAEAKYPQYFRDGKKDFKAWAKRLIYRAERNDPDIDKVRLGYAQRAMENKGEEN